MANERITIITEMIDNITGKTKQITNSVQEMNKGINRTTTTVDKYNKGLVQSSVTTNKTVTGLRRFNFAWLSVMFAGMALNRVFGSLIKSQLELFGVNELFGGVLTLVMLPIMETLLPLFLKLSEFFMNLPDSVKLGIGAFIIFGSILGIILTIIGQVMLAFGGFAMLLPGIGAGGTSAIGALVTSLGTIILVIGAVIAVVIGFYHAWRDNFLGMKTVVSNLVNSIKQHFGGLVEIFRGLLNIIVGIFTLNFDKIWNGIKLVFKGIWDFIVGGFKIAFNAVLAILIGVLNTVREIANLAFKVGAVVGNVFTGKGFTTKGALQIPSFQTGGIMPNTGLAYLHQGERIIPKNEVNNGSGITISPTYYVTVSDKREFEAMLERNNRNIINETRRLVKI